MKGNRLEGVRRLAESAPENMVHLIESVRFRDSARSLNYCFEWLASSHRDLAIYDYYIETNVAGFKQHLYLASLLDAKAIALYDHQRFTVGSEIFYALLSDSPKAIDMMVTLTTPYFQSQCGNPLNSEFKVHMYQLAIRGDYASLQAKVERLAKNGPKKERVLAAQQKDFFSLLMKEDKSSLETLIAEHAKTNSQSYLTEDFMCYQGTMEAKICWLKGIQVQIDSPLLPMALMPVEPLAHYDDVYDFLKPGYVAPKVGLFERLRYWYKERAKRREGLRRAIEASKPKPP